MNRNLKIAKELVKLAKSLVAGKDDNEFKKYAIGIAKKEMKDDLEEMGWRFVDLDNSKLIKVDDRNAVDFLVEDFKDDVDWKDVDKYVDGFNRYGGHYKCVFDTSEKNHIVIRDSEW